MLHIIRCMSMIHINIWRASPRIKKEGPIKGIVSLFDGLASRYYQSPLPWGLSYAAFLPECLRLLHVYKGTKKKKRINTSDHRMHQRTMLLKWWVRGNIILVRCFRLSPHCRTVRHNRCVSLSKCFYLVQVNSFSEQYGILVSAVTPESYLIFMS